MDVAEDVTTQPLDDLQVSLGGYSTAGSRKANQDAFAAHCPHRDNVKKYKGIVACIADGVSCSENGQQASHTSVTQFIDDYYSTPDSWGAKHSAARVLKALNSWLYFHGCQSDLRHNGLVTTFSSIIFKSNTAHLLHIGDSRIYRYRQHRLVQLTSDHSRKQGGKSHFLTRALGMDNRLDVDYRRELLEQDDIFVLSTDGLHDWLTEPELAGLLSVHGQSLKARARTIVERAIENGSTDNVTCLLLSVDALPEENLQEAERRLTQRVIPPVMKEGNRIDQYEITRVIHSGSRSHVYLAASQFDGKSYVLKVPSQNFSDDMLYLQGFIREGWLGNQIDHPSVMKIHRYSMQSSFLYHVCDYVEGTTLRQWMLDNPEPTLEKVRVIASELVKSLRYLQRMGIVHRDLKPENIILTDKGWAVFIDFGTAQVEGLEDIAGGIKESIPVGDIDYMAPEYLAGKKATPFSDLFSVGIIIYEMLTGQKPYERLRSTVYDVTQRQDFSYVSTLTYRNDIPAWMDLVLKKVCHPLPQCRYQVMSEFLQDLSTPNPAIVKELKGAPLLEKNPLLAWKVFTWVLLIIVIVETYFLMR
ncbi:Serine/threonine protein kinase [Photobacterium marinum]|uniref:Serine/threonine protein kinase n=1 Tax=Photobacterium marinum TaxID=1056511 RepID=L8JGQ4_9GAMM|nr:bifunctional protein-serine/threonine kinase/phosphatase [Photobacterium marinum]ELR67433.1 Serine/threonine protein kinase [Photobacterium marinum]